MAAEGDDEKEQISTGRWKTESPSSGMEETNSRFNASGEMSNRSASAVPLKAAEAEAGASFASRTITPTDETSSFADTTSTDGQYEVIEYDPSDPDVLGEVEPTIDDNTPAAEALRANANVHVSSMGKAARAVNMQAVRKFVKRATGTTKSGVARGKPPRIPETKANSNKNDGLEPIVECDEPDTKPSPSDELHVDPDDIHPDTVVAGTVEAGKKVLRAVDPHDMLKLLRWRRKRNGGANKVTKSYVKGKVIDGEHELYTLSIAVMIGVRTSISRTNTCINAGPEKRWVQLQDFRTTEKYEFRPKGGGATPPHRLAHTFKFKDYCPLVFAYLRRMYGVNEFDFLLSVCGNANFIEFISNAKSGQFFFYSSDGRYMIKTMTNAESKFLRRMLPHYFRHCAENPNTIITRFFGMYRVKLYHLRRNVKFVIMNSVYYTDKYLQTFYDLKGSSAGRDAKPGQAVKKDNDLRRGLPEEAFALHADQRKRVRNQMVSDCKFMEEMGIMDFSMLVGVHHIPPVDDSSIATVGFRGPRHRTRQKSIRGDGDSTDFMPELGGHSLRSIFAETAAKDPNSVSCAGGIGVDLARNSDGRSTGETIGTFFFDDALDDDESSYLVGSDHRHHEEAPSLDKETEAKTQCTIEKLYWPFHRLYDIHGYRRLAPVQCHKCGCNPCSCTEDDHILRGFNIPKFVAPLSDRKDGGFEMDTTGLNMPMVLKTPQGDQLYEGKIFYMGIIDVLQEYNSRKMVETKYRLLQMHGEYTASCVPPDEYGHRFLNFFDEVSQRPCKEDDKAQADGESIEIGLHGVSESTTASN